MYKNVVIFFDILGVYFYENIYRDRLFLNIFQLRKVLNKV